MSSSSSSPDYISGANHLFKECILGFSALTILFYLLQIPGRSFAPADKYCTEESNTYPPPCIRPSLFAFEGVCGAVFIMMTIYSIKAWHFDKHPQKCIPQTAAGRVFGYSSQCEKITALTFVFQIWSCAFTPFIPEFFSTVMMSHHIMASLVSFLSLQYQLYHYYTIFFFALTEVSSVPLVVMSLGKYYPDSIYGTIVPVAQPLFALSFTFYRVYLWNKISYQLWSDAMVVFKKNKNANGNTASMAQEFRPGRTFGLYLILFADVALGLLQLFWFAKILTEILKLLGIEFMAIDNVGY